MNEEPEILEIVVDDRERRTTEFVDAVEFWLNDPQFSNFRISYERLEACDLICRTETRIGTTGIEVKRGFDFLESIFDGRYPNQVIQVKEQVHIDNLIFIFVGDVKDVLRRNVDPSAYYGAIGALTTKYGCPIIPVPDNESAVLQSFYCFKHSNLVPRVAPIFKVKVNNQERQMAMLSCMEGIGRKTAEKILIRFSISDLAKIENPKIISNAIKGVGLKTAKYIVRFFSDPDF